MPQIARPNAICAGHKMARIGGEKKAPTRGAGAQNDSVGAPGFEPGTSCSQSRRDTGLRYAPKMEGKLLYPPLGAQRS